MIASRSHFFGLLAVIIHLVAAKASAAGEKIWTPAESAKIALADARSIPGGRSSYARYLSHYWAPVPERQGYIQASSFLANSLSGARVIYQPVVVAGSDGTLVRILLDELEISPKEWDRLIAEGSGPNPSNEPYFTTQFQRVEDTYETQEVYTGRDRYNRPQYARQQVKTGTRTRSTLAASPLPGLAVGDIAQLQAATQTQFPIASTDWFVVNATLEPAYHRLLKFDDFKSFEALFFADQKEAARARVQIRGAVVFSGVGLNNRWLNRIPTIGSPLGGYLWFSQDLKSSVGKNDVVNNPLGKNFDAVEAIGSTKTGLQAYGVFDDKGKRLDRAAAGIAQDGETILLDRQVEIRNCMFCHRGIRSINDEVRALSREQIALLVVDPKDARNIADQYFATDLGQVVDHDNAFFAAALKTANGLTPGENSKLLEKIIQQYVDQPVTAERLAARAGVSVETLLGTLKQAKGIDHTLVGFLQNPPRPARRDQIEKSFGQLMLLLGEAR